MQYTQMAPYYDKLYNRKDYLSEITNLLELIKPYIKHNFTNWLDVACGTGKHLEHLKKHFHCMGLDICPQLLDIAKQRNPELVFILGDMQDFVIDHKFDVISCMFGSIGHTLTIDNLKRTISNMKKHLNPEGMMIIEPWHTPEQFKAGRIDLITIDEPEIKLARCCSSQVKDKLSVLDMHHLVCRPDGTNHFIEHLELGLFSESEYKTTLADGGYTVLHEKIRDNGNGVYLVFKR